MENLPIGCIFCYPSPICPEGFMPCDGRELSKQAYPELYAVIKNTWGETDTTFSLPDLQGLFVRGWDKDENIDPQRKFGSEQIDTLQGHRHELSISGKMTEAGLNYKHHEIKYGTNTFAEDSSLSFNSLITPIEKQSRDYFANHFKKIFGVLIKDKGDSEVRHSHELPKIEIGDVASSTFQQVRVSTETRPKNVALMYCIKCK